MIKKVLIANRGEIARRIIRTARRMGIATVAVYSDADRHALHVKDADEAVHIGPSPAIESYLLIERIINAAKATGADAIHPGYGFLSENADLPDACAKAGIAFVGPRGEAMRALGGKAAAKDIAIKAGVPVVPGYQGRAQDVATLTKEAGKIGYPVMIKAVAGGGGRGMRLVSSAAELPELLESARREAQSAFGNPDVLIEKVVVAPRHIEVQVFGDTKGNVVHLFERDCTLQRRNQKVIEEAPAPGMSAALREKICGAAVKLAKSVNYEGAGTVEFLVEGGALDATAKWYFIEMNTRLQVEHPVTEEITGLDLVEWQLRVASGEALPKSQAEISMCGHAIEARLCAEDPAKGFLPSVGRIADFRAAELRRLRVETGVASGDSVSPFYDSMIAKLIVCGADRNEAMSALAEALSETRVQGVKTNLAFLHALAMRDDVRMGRMDTGLIGRHIDDLTQSPPDARRVAMGVRVLLEEKRLRSEAGAAGDPWSSRDAFAINGPRELTVKVVADGQPRTARARWNGATLSVSVDDVFGHWREEEIASGDARVVSAPENAIAGARNGTAHVYERMHHTTVTWPVFDASQVEDDPGHASIRAPINGRVAKLFVALGDSVEKGQRIAVVEAMKMEHVLVAGIAGTVDKLPAAEGAQVAQGTVLATIAA